VARSSNCACQPVADPVVVSSASGRCQIRKPRRPMASRRFCLLPTPGGKCGVRLGQPVPSHVSRVTLLDQLRWSVGSPRSGNLDCLFSELPDSRGQVLDGCSVDRDHPGEHVRFLQTQVVDRPARLTTCSSPGVRQLGCPASTAGSLGHSPRSAERVSPSKLRVRCFKPRVVAYCTGPHGVHDPHSSLRRFGRTSHRHGCCGTDMGVIGMGVSLLQRRARWQILRRKH
jgi:hypothetical protein